MLFTEKLNKKGYIIYVSGFILAIITLIIIQLQVPSIGKGLSFAIFATVYFIGFGIAKNHTKKDE